MGSRKFARILRRRGESFGPHERLPQLMLLEEIYKTNISGITTEIALDENGDASSNFDIINFQVRKSNTSSKTNSSLNSSEDYVYEWISVGRVSAFTNPKVTLQQPTQFPGSTPSAPLIVPTDDGTIQFSSSDGCCAPYEYALIAFGDLNYLTSAIISRKDV